MGYRYQILAGILVMFGVSVTGAWLSWPASKVAPPPRWERMQAERQRALDLLVLVKREMATAERRRRV